MASRSLQDPAPGRRRHRFAYSIAFALALAIVFAVIVRLSEPVPAPDIGMRTIEGERLAFADFRGKVVLVNFWATDCTVCLREMPAMIETHRSFQARGFEAVFVAMPHDRPDRVLHYARRNALPFKVVLDVQGEINRAFGDIRATPTTFIVDKQGRIVDRILGEPDFNRLRQFIARKLDEPGTDHVSGR